MTCAEPLKLSASRLAAHVKKEKTRNDVCGAAQAIHPSPCSTRQKRKKQEMTCAEPPKLSPLRPVAHAKKKKTRNDVCGAAPPSQSCLKQELPRPSPPTPSKKQLPMQHFPNLCIKSIKRGGRRCKKKKRNW